MDTGYLFHMLISAGIMTNSLSLLSCSPSVLDRLNPLLEPNGVLTIDERGIVGGDVPVAKPHPEFRYYHTSLYLMDAVLLDYF